MNQLAQLMLTLFFSAFFSINSSAALIPSNTEGVLRNEVDTIIPNHDFGIGGYVRTANHVTVKGVSIFSYFDTIPDWTAVTNSSGTFSLGFYLYPYFDKNFYAELEFRDTNIFYAELEFRFTNMIFSIKYSMINAVLTPIAEPKSTS